MENVMPKMSTTITAKRLSCCPLCSIAIKRGEKTKVYNGGWYHPACCEEVKLSVKRRRELAKLY